jgi:hypothetical protein
MTRPDPYDFGAAIDRRKRAVERAAQLGADHAGDAAYDRLRALVADAARRLREIPAPMMEHTDLLAQYVVAERAVVDELDLVLERQPPPAAAPAEPAHADPLPADAP